MLTIFRKSPQLSVETRTRNGLLWLIPGVGMPLMTDRHSGATLLVTLARLRLVTLPRVEVQMIPKLSRLLAVFRPLNRLKTRLRI